MKDVLKHMSRGEIAGLALVLVGFVLTVWHGMAFGLRNPELTRSQIMIENWRWILFSMGLMAGGMLWFYKAETDVA